MSVTQYFPRDEDHSRATFGQLVILHIKYERDMPQPVRLVVSFASSPLGKLKQYKCKLRLSLSENYN